MAVFSFGSSSAQRKVESGAYNLMLKTLLSHSVEEISVDEAAKAKDAVFIDSREQQEYKVSHIKDAVWVGYEDFDIKRMNGVPKDKKVIVYCSVGKRSEDITERLQKAGYKDIANMYGGIFEWANSGKPLYNKQGKTDTVHAYSKTWGIWLNKGEKVYE
jgi:rhodanese-related sulfurtransferase